MTKIRCSRCGFRHKHKQKCRRRQVKPRFNPGSIRVQCSPEMYQRLLRDLDVRLGTVFRPVINISKTGLHLVGYKPA